MINNSVGILLTNIGTPSAPTPQAVRTYLKKFLSDPRVVECPKIIWWPILHGIILPFRSRSSAKLYQCIWTQQGSPLLLNSQKIAQKLEAQLHIPVELGMHYSEPSISTALNTLRKKQVQKIIVLPLYPQYSATTTASTFDFIANTFKTWRNIPALSIIRDYADHPAYIAAIVHSIQETWKKHGKKYVLFSFHGIPQKYISAGDIYAERCQLTVKLITEALQLTPNEWTIAFQSRLGRTKWLTPYMNDVLAQLPKQGITDIQVISPGFPVDCLETLEEIAIRGKKQFLQAGGHSFEYIPALNDEEKHIALLSQIVKDL